MPSAPAQAAAAAPSTALAPPLGSQPGTVTSTRSGRSVRFPTRLYQDYVPSGPSTALSDWTAIFPPGSPSESPSPQPSSPGGDTESDPPPTPTEERSTPTDAFGLFRVFRRVPKNDPDLHFSLDSICDTPGLDNPDAEGEDPRNERSGSASIFWLTQGSAAVDDADDSDKTTFGPFGASATRFRLVDWFYGRGSEVLSLERFDDLLDIIRSKGFTPAEVEGFSARKAERMLETWGKEEKVFRPQHGWHTSPVHVPMPCTKVSFASEDTVPKFKVPGLQHRDIVDLVLDCISDKTSRFAHNYHFVPNKMYWTPPKTQPRATTPLSGQLSRTSLSLFPPMSNLRLPSIDTSSSTKSSPPPLRVFTDCYNSDAMLEEDEIIRKMERIPSDDPNTEYVALPMLLWSDETVLSSFGSAKLWPIYLYIGSLSKYVRGRPTEFAAHHLAYIPDVRSLLVFTWHCTDQVLVAG